MTIISNFPGGKKDISKGTTDALANELLINKKAVVEGQLIIGTMPNNGAVDYSLAVNEKFSIPIGYHDGTGAISQDIPVKAAEVFTPGTAAQTIIAGQYLDGNQTIAGDADLVASNIKSGVNIFGVVGTAPVPSGNAFVADVLANKTFSNGSSVGLTGTMPNNGAVAPAALNAGGSYTIPAGYHNGSGKVTTNTLASQTIASAVAGDILATKTAWVGGSSITGSMVNRGAITKKIIMQNGMYVVPAGYHNGTGQVTVNISNLVADNIKAGVNVGGVEGTFSGPNITIGSSVSITSGKLSVSGLTFQPNFVGIWVVRPTDGASGVSGNYVIWSAVSLASNGYTQATYSSGATLYTNRTTSSSAIGNIVMNSSGFTSNGETGSQFWSGSNSYMWIAAKI